MGFAKELQDFTAGFESGQKMWDDHLVKQAQVAKANNDIERTRKPTDAEVEGQPGFQYGSNKVGNTDVSGSDTSGLAKNDVYNGFMDTVKTQITNPYGLAAVASTGTRESGFDPGKAGSTWDDLGKPSGGIMSWRDDRLRAMQQFSGGKMGTPQQQAQFFLQEDPELIKKLNAAGSVEEAQDAMNSAWKFAGWDQPSNERAARLKTAQSLVASFEGGGAPTTQTASAQPSSAPGTAQPQQTASAAPQKNKPLQAPTIDVPEAQSAPAIPQPSMLQTPAMPQMSAVKPISKPAQQVASATESQPMTPEERERQRAIQGSRMFANEGGVIPPAYAMRKGGKVPEEDDELPPWLEPNYDPATQMTPAGRAASDSRALQQRRRSAEIDALPETRNKDDFIEPAIPMTAAQAASARAKPAVPGRGQKEEYASPEGPPQTVSQKVSRDTRNVPGRGQKEDLPPKARKDVSAEPARRADEAAAASRRNAEAAIPAPPRSSYEPRRTGGPEDIPDVVSRGPQSPPTGRSMPAPPQDVPYDGQSTNPEFRVPDVVSSGPQNPPPAPVQPGPQQGPPRPPTFAPRSSTGEAPASVPAGPAAPGVAQPRMVTPPQEAQPVIPPPPAATEGVFAPRRPTPAQPVTPEEPDLIPAAGTPLPPSPPGPQQGPNLPTPEGAIPLPTARPAAPTAKAPPTAVAETRPLPTHNRTTGAGAPPEGKSVAPVQRRPGRTGGPPAPEWGQRSTPSNAARRNEQPPTVSQWLNNRSRGIAKQSIHHGIGFLTQQFGLGQQGAVASPQDQQRQQAGIQEFVSGKGASTPEEIRAIDAKIDPNNEMSNQDKVLQRYTKTYQWYMQQGRPKEAAAAAGSLMQYGAQMFGQLGNLSAAALKDYNTTKNPASLQHAIDFLDKAYEYVPDGESFNVDLNPQTHQIVATKGDQTFTVQPQELPALVRSVQDRSAYWQSIYAIADPAGARAAATSKRTDERQASRDARTDARLADRDAKIETRQAARDAKIDAREAQRTERTAGKDPDWDTVMPLQQAAADAQSALNEDPENQQLKDDLNQKASALFDALPAKDRPKLMGEQFNLPMGTWKYVKTVAPSATGATPAGGPAVAAAPPAGVPPEAKLDRKSGKWIVKSPEGKWVPVLTASQ